MYDNSLITFCMHRSGLIRTINRHACKASRHFTFCTIPDDVWIALVVGIQTDDAQSLLCAPALSVAVL